MAISGSHKEYRDGDMVACQQCGKKNQVKWFATKQSALVPPGEREKLALRCQACGFITCSACAHPGDSMFPVCPNCQKEWGPYYFIGGPATPPSPVDSVIGEDTSPKRNAQEGSWERAVRMELPKASEISEELFAATPKRFSRLKGSPVILLVFLLIGVVIAGLLFVLLRLPAITEAISGMMPEATPTAMTLNATDTLATPTLLHDQNVVIDGFIQSPVDKSHCQKQEDGFEWCRVLIDVDKRPVEVWVRLGSPANALTANLQFLDNDGSLIPSGSDVSLEGIASCNDANDCQIRIQTIRTIQAATFTPTPTIAKSPTPTLSPTATRFVTETSVPSTTPTESGCVDALSVTLDNLKQELCVQGTVSEIFEQDQATLLLFDKQATSFMFISYDPPLDFVKVGMCLVGTGKVQQLGKRPVIVITYQTVPVECP